MQLGQTNAIATKKANVAEKESMTKIAIAVHHAIMKLNIKQKYKSQNVHIIAH